MFIINNNNNNYVDEEGRNESWNNILCPRIVLMRLRVSVRFACQHVRSDIKELKRKFPTFGLILHWQEANNLQKERKKSRFKKCKERRDLKEKSKQRTLLRVKSYLSDLNSHLSTRPISQPD